MEKLYSYLDYLDAAICRVGLLPIASWDMARKKSPLRLYAGKLRRALPQFRTHIGLTPFFPSSRNIPHDICKPLPLADNSVDSYQSEDVFEHVPIETIPGIFDEIYRVLKPGGLFRLSVPDYGCDIYQKRSVRDVHGNIIFDPGGGGRFENGVVLDGGHVWFPTYDLVREVFDKSRVCKEGTVSFQHPTPGPADFLLEDIDYNLGSIQRTPDNDRRPHQPRRPLSIVVDAYKTSAP
jgi:SAM-dependent methyltransferase